MIGPADLNIKLKAISGIAKGYDGYAGSVMLGDDKKALIELCDEIIQGEYDMDYFSDSDIEYVQYNVLCIQAMVIMELGVNVVVDEIKEIRRVLLDRVMVKNLLFVDRMFKGDEFIGTLAVLPELALHDIREKLIRWM